MKKRAVVDLERPRWQKVDSREFQRFTTAVSEKVVKPVEARSAKQRDQIARVRAKFVR
jgi:hypothetical protein